MVNKEIIVTLEIKKTSNQVRNHAAKNFLELKRRLTFENLFLSLDTDFPSIFQLDRFSFVHIAELGFTADFS